MKWLRSLLMAGAIVFAAGGARADDGAGKTLMITGGAIFGAGYLPVAVPGLASGFGLLGRFVALFFTFGLPCVGRDDDPGAPPAPPNYLCDGTHGSIMLMFPIAGPFLYADAHAHDSIIHPSGAPLSPVAKDLLYTSGAVQAAGALVFFVGAAIFGATSGPPKQSADAPRKEGPRFSVLPTVTSSSIGVSASLVAW